MEGRSYCRTIPETARRSAAGSGRAGAATDAKARSIAVHSSVWPRLAIAVPGTRFPGQNLGLDPARLSWWMVMIVRSSTSISSVEFAGRPLWRPSAFQGFWVGNSLLRAAESAPARLADGLASLQARICGELPDRGAG